MAFRWIPWLLANEFVHMRSFMDPLMRHEGLPPELARRLRARIRAGIRLVKIRTIFYAIMFPAVLALLASFVFLALETVLTQEVLEGLQKLVAILVNVMSVLFVIAAAGVFVTNRAIRLLRVDVYMLSMEAVAIGVEAGAETPSTQRVELKTPKE